MVRLGYAETIDAIYATCSHPNGWAGALEAIADHIGAASGMLVSNDLRSGQANMIGGRLHEGLTNLFLDHYVVNEITVASARRPDGQVNIGSQMLGAAGMRRTALYADILAPQGIDDMLTFPLRHFRGQHAVGGLGFNLTRDQAVDAGTVARQLHALGSHVSRAVDLSIGYRLHRQLGAHPFALLEAVPTASFLLDAGGRLVVANALGERALGEETLVRLDADRRVIPAYPDPGRERRWWAMLADAVDVASGRGRREQVGTHIGRRDGSDFAIARATPLPPGAFTGWELRDLCAFVLLQVIDPKQDVAPAVAFLAAQFDLTPAEKRVATLIGSGLSLPQASARLGIAPSTARTHLSRCFDKTGVRSQVALVRLIALVGGTSIGSDADVGS